MLNEERNLKRTNLAKGKKRNIQTNKHINSSSSNSNKQKQKEKNNTSSYSATTAAATRQKYK